MQIDEEDYENHLKNKGDVTEKIVIIKRLFNLKYLEN